jgi:peptidoglycan/LPS O-acetylase OafA/YrhL
MPKDANNFDFLRLFAAGLVLVSHLYPLSGMKQDRVLRFLDSLGLGTLGVSIFFVISGYLVMKSWARDPDPQRYASRRVLRIYPALIGVVLIAMLLLGPLVTKLSLLDYFSDLLFLSYLNVLLLFPMSYALPGVFYDNPYSISVNGPLWTLPYEATMYLLLPLFARPKLRDSALFWVSIAALFIIASTLSRGPYFQTVWFMNPEWLYYFGAFFFYGAALAALERKIGAPNLAVAGVFLLTLIFSWHTEWSALIRLLLLGYVVIAVGVRRTPFLSSASRCGDFSYGIYIYAFPVQQTLVHFGLGTSVLLNLLYLVTITVALAVLSWVFIEKRALLMKPSKPSFDPGKR